MNLCHIEYGLDELILFVNQKADKSNVYPLWAFGFDITYHIKLKGKKIKAFRDERMILTDLYVYPNKDLAIYRAIECIDAYFHLYFEKPHEMGLYNRYLEWKRSDANGQITELQATGFSWAVDDSDNLI